MLAEETLQDLWPTFDIQLVSDNQLVHDVTGDVQHVVSVEVQHHSPCEEDRDTVIGGHDKGDVTSIQVQDRTCQ